MSGFHLTFFPTMPEDGIFLLKSIVILRNGSFQPFSYMHTNHEHAFIIGKKRIILFGETI
jgi:hypothetical protein